MFTNIQQPQQPQQINPQNIQGQQQPQNALTAQQYQQLQQAQQQYQLLQKQQQQQQQLQQAQQVQQPIQVQQQQTVQPVQSIGQQPPQVVQQAALKNAPIQQSPNIQSQQAQSQLKSSNQQVQQQQQQTQNTLKMDTESIEILLKKLLEPNANLSLEQTKDILEQCKQKISVLESSNMIFQYKHKLFAQCVAYQNTIFQHIRVTMTPSSTTTTTSTTNNPVTANKSNTTSSNNTNSNNINNELPISKELIKDKLLIWKMAIQFIKDNLIFFSKWRESIYVSIQNITQSTYLPILIQADFFKESFELLKQIFSFVNIQFPYYIALKEIKLSNTHQSLEFQRLIEPFYCRASRLSTLLSLSSLSSTARLVGSTISLNQDNMISYTNQLTESPPFFTSNSFLNNKYSSIVHHLLSQCATIDPIKDLLFPQVQSSTLKSKIISIITEASISKTLQLLNKYPNQIIENQIESISWKEWLLFSEQFFSLVEGGLIDLEQYIYSLSEKRMNNGDPIKDNMVVFLISKTIIIPDVKLLFKQDSQIVNSNHYGSLIPMILSFMNKDSINYPIISQNTSFYFFLMRVEPLVNPETVLYIKKLYEQHQYQFTLFQQYRAWWDSEKVKQRQEFFTTIQDITYFSIICNVIASEGEAELIKFQCIGDNPFCYPYVGSKGLTVIGKIKPVSNLILLNLSLRFRRKLIQESIIHLFDKDIPISPGFLEDYCRTVYYTPSPLSPYILTYLNKKFERLVSIHAIVEALSHRLIKVLKSNKELPLLFRAVQDIQNQKPTLHNYQLARSVEYLLLKASNSITIDVLTAKDLLKSLNLGTMYNNRRLIISIAKLVKVKGLSDFNKINDISILIENCFKQFPYCFSKSTIEYFPEFMKLEYKKVLDNYMNAPQFANHINVINKAPTLQKVQLENQQRIQLFSMGDKLPLQQKLQQLLFYQQDSNSNLLLCQTLIIVLELKIKIEIIAPLVQQFLFVNISQPQQSNQPQQPNQQQSMPLANTNQLLSKLTSVFIDFILDEVLVNHQLAIQNKQDLLQKVSEFICQMIFKYKILNLNTVIIGLCDRDDDNDNGAASMTLIDLILFGNSEIQERLQFLINHPSQSFSTQSFRDDDNYFLKNHEFNSKFNDLIPSCITDVVANNNNTTNQEIPIQEILPIYYSNSISRFMPVLEILLSKSIELSNKELFEKLINNFNIPYRYYQDEKEITIRDTLNYYYDSQLFKSNPDLKLLFLKFLNNSNNSTIENESRFSNYFNQFLKSNKIEDITSIAFNIYFAQLVTPFADMLDLSSGADVFNTFTFKTENTYSLDISNPVELKLNNILLELLLLPVEPQFICNGLFSLLNYRNNINSTNNSSNNNNNTASSSSSSNSKNNFPNREDPPSSSMVLALSIIFSTLPLSIHNILIPTLTSNLTKELNLSKFKSPIMKNQYLFGNYNTNVEEKMTIPIEWYIYFTQFYFLYCPLERLLSLTEMVSNIRPYIKNVYQFYIVLTIVSPVLSRFGAQSNHSISMIRELLQMLTDSYLSNYIESTLQELDSNWIGNSNDDNDAMNINYYNNNNNINASGSNSNRLKRKRKGGNFNSFSQDIQDDQNNDNDNYDYDDSSDNSSSISSGSDDNYSDDDDDDEDNNNNNSNMMDFGNDNTSLASNIFNTHRSHSNDHIMMMSDTSSNVSDPFVDSNQFYRNQKQLLLKIDSQLIDTIVDWIHHIKMIFPYQPFREEVTKIVKEFKPNFILNFNQLN